jgi:hypothetical protein
MKILCIDLKNAIQREKINASNYTKEKPGSPKEACRVSP